CEVAWYPLAYPKPEMAKCPRCEREEETQAHFFKCKQGDPKRGKKDWGGQETKATAECGWSSQQQQQATARGQTACPRGRGG
ncbi:hypothetical protein EV182_004378, partial [Spiromyces aspiralis]